MNHTTTARTRTRSSRRPSVALLAAAATGAALLVAVSGGGAAVATGLAFGSVDSRHVKDGSLRGADLRDGTVTGKDVDEATLGTVELARAAGTADHALSALSADTAERLLGMTTITVSADGVVRPVDEAEAQAHQTDTPGRYEVSLNSLDLGCPVFASVAHNDVEPVVGSASAWRTAPLLENGRVVVVETHAPDGDATPDPLPFNLLIVC